MQHVEGHEIFLELLDTWHQELMELVQSLEETGVR